MVKEDTTFLAELFKKKASVLQTGDTTGKNVSSGILEVDRQIQQCLKGGNLRIGKGVTKSGKED
ncbi:MAG: hypothetical protein COY80_02465 [Candidatus Pacebacteria bacterium CG_4_10_14_0_8_um_filter_42_14]|nr:MAG: hypothetical protein COY80_02465 [Candidatus Pacebacteria bacterium CG_4_10_14_0_8_um_filter_42_14]